MCNSHVNTKYIKSCIVMSMSSKIYTWMQVNHGTRVIVFKWHNSCTATALHCNCCTTLIKHSSISSVKCVRLFVTVWTIKWFYTNCMFHVLELLISGTAMWNHNKTRVKLPIKTAIYTLCLRERVVLNFCNNFAKS